MEKEKIRQLKGLYEEQKKALQNYDFAKLRDVNKKIFLINDYERQKNKKQFEIKRDNRLAQRIEEKLLEREREL